MAKQRKEATLVQVAEEMNEVMAYGCNDKGELVDPNEQIDTELSDKALLKCLKERAKEDLRAGDEGSFSPEVWDWFVDNNLAPDPNSERDTDLDENDDKTVSDGVEGDDADNPDSDDDPDGEPNNEPDEDTRKPRQAPPAKVKRDSNPDKAEKAQKGDSKARKTENRADTRAEGEKTDKGKERAANPDSTKKPKRTGVRPTAMAKGGNENFAVDLVKKGTEFPDFYQDFADLYKECKPDATESFVLSRAKIYWNIAHKKLGKTTPPAELDDKPNKKSGKKREDEDTGRSARRNRR